MEFEAGAKQDERPLLLLVDDAPDHLRVMNGVLREHYRLKAAGNGERALEIARQLPQPDLILLDMSMPGMGGDEVLRQLKADPETSEIPVIFVTAREEQADEEMGLALGAVDYITKPVRPPILLARVATHVKLRAVQLELVRLATTDELTGCYNRRYFLQRAESELQRHRRYHHPLTLLLFDIDHFKYINDQCGHALGDEVLRRVVRRVASVLREADLFARIGGEEFFVLLPETTLEDGLRIAERLRRELHLRIEGYDARLSVSIGAATLEERDTGIEPLMRRADDNLYVAKRHGRDCVMPLATQPQEPGSQ